MNKFAPITILSIDPGYDRVGWAIGELSGTSYHLVNCGCIETNSKADIFARYMQIQEELEGIISVHQPKIAALETLYFSKNRTTAIRVSEARGIIIATLLNHQLELFEYNPGEIKLAVTGYGNADKKAVEKMVRMQTQVNQNKLLDDALDAVAVGMTHALTSHALRTKAALNKAAGS